MNAGFRILRLESPNPGYNFSQADLTGAILAEQFLIASLVRYGVVAEVIEINYDDDSRAMTVKEKGLGEMRDTYDVKRIPLAQLRDIADTPLVALCSLSQMPALSSLRSALDLRFPICGITHAIPMPYLIQSFTAVILSVEACDRIVISSRAGVEAVEKILDSIASSFGIAESRKEIIRHIPLIVADEGGATPEQSCCRRLLGLQGDDRVALYVGRLTKTYKADLEPLLRCFKSARDHVKNLRLLIAGHEAEQGYVQEIQRLCNQLQIIGSVNLIRDFPGWTRPLIYGAADFVVAPSDNLQETYGLSVLEAMQAGKAVIASNWSGYRDLVEQDVTGILLDIWIQWGDTGLAAARFSADMSLMFPREIAKNTILHTDQLTSALNRLGADKDACDRMGRNARVRYDRDFGERDLTKRYSELWEEQVTVAYSKNTTFGVKHVSAREVFAGFPLSARQLSDMETDDPEWLVSQEQEKGGSKPVRIKVGELLDVDEELCYHTSRLLKRGQLQIHSQTTQMRLDSE